MPFDTLSNTRPLRDMSRLMDDFFRLPISEVASTHFPPADVTEDADAYTVSVETPGVRKEDIHISVQENTLSLRVTKTSDMKAEGKNYRHVERFYGTFERHFPFASSIDASKIQATYKDGVLQITLPKAENARERKIEVNVQ
jgi:HSP20 family protein